jgi:hypothetical protein
MYIIHIMNLKINILIKKIVEIKFFKTFDLKKKFNFENYYFNF